MFQVSRGKRKLEEKSLRPGEQQVRVFQKLS